MRFRDPNLSFTLSPFKENLNFFVLAGVGSGPVLKPAGPTGRLRT